MSARAKPTKEERRHYARLVGCVVVRVLWDQAGGQPLPVLVVSTPGGGIAECVVFSNREQSAPGYLRHDI
jgi:hypothetical protein